MYKENIDYLYGGENNKVCIEASVKESLFSFSNEIQKEKELFQKKIIFILIGVIILIIVFAVILYKVNKKNIENINKIRIRDSLLLGEEKERQRIGKELHDGVCSDLTAVKMNLEMLKSGPLETIEKFEKISIQLKETNDSIRDISHNLNSIMLTKFGLNTAIQQLCEKIKEFNKIKITTDITPKFVTQLSKSIETNIYRIVQELFNNIIKHAKATEVFCGLYQMGKIIKIEIRDIGVGFDKNIKFEKNCVGLNNIKYRVDLLGGKLSIESEINRGAIFIIEIPLT